MHVPLFSTFKLLMYIYPITDIYKPVTDKWCQTLDDKLKFYGIDYKIHLSYYYYFLNKSNNRFKFSLIGLNIFEYHSF